MSSLALLPFTPGIRRTYATYPVWSNSQRADIGVGARETQPPKNANAERKRLARMYRKARRWKARDPHIMTQGALRVFESLCFDFANSRTGQLYPSHATIARRCGLSITCVKEALSRLRELGLVWWQRRCVLKAQELGGFLMKQVTNLYTLLPPGVWAGFEEEEEEQQQQQPAPEPHEYGGRAPTILYGDEAGLQAVKEAGAEGHSPRSAARAGIAALAETAMSEAERNLAALFRSIAETEH